MMTVVYKFLLMVDQGIIMNYDEFEHHGKTRIAYEQSISLNILYSSKEGNFQGATLPITAAQQNEVCSGGWQWLQDDGEHPCLTVCCRFQRNRKDVPSMRTTARVL